MNYKKILVPIDFSNCAYNALEYAMAFAESNESKLVLLHAYHIPIPVAETEIYIDVNRIEDFEKDTQQRMTEVYQRYPQLKELTHSHHAKAAFATDAILQQAEESGCELIIMGTHGATNTFDELVGSNTLHIIKRSNIPVLAIPQDFEGFDIKQILFAFDYQHIGSKETMQPLIQFALALGATLHILHITDKLEKLHQGAIEEAKALERYLKDTPHNYHMMENEHVEEGIMDYIKANDIDVLAVMPRKHNLLERLFKSSITKQLVHHSKIPLLGFHLD